MVPAQVRTSTANGIRSVLVSRHIHPLASSTITRRVLIARAEWYWALGASVLILLFSSLPYLAGYASETTEWRFGGAVFDRQDYNVHLASIQVGLRGEWQYRMLYTSEEMPPASIKLFYVFIGQVGRVIPLTPPMLYQVVRWITGLGMLLTLYAFAAQFIRAIAWRRVAFLISALGSGIGWLLLILRWQPQPEVSPIDFWLIDLYGFFSLLVFPHFSAVMALLWLTMLTMLQHWTTRQWRWLVLALICVVGMQIIQPFGSLIVTAVLLAYAVWGWLARATRFPFTSLSLFILVQIPLGIYTFWILFSDPLWSKFSAQNITLSPEPVYYVLGLGIPGILAIGGMWYSVPRRFDQIHLLVVWLIVVAILVYLPLASQRRFTIGVSAPIGVLAAFGLRNVLWRCRWLRRVRGSIILLTLAMTMLSTFYLTLGSVLLVSARAPNLFDPAPVVEAIDWLGTVSDDQDVVLSAERTGNLIPARIGRRVYVGHAMETLDYARKVQDVERFFGTEMRDDERRALLESLGCRFVFWGPYERALGDFQPVRMTSLRLVYSNESVSIFRVMN